MHGTYYIVKNDNLIWWFVFFNKTYCFQLEWRRIELKKILHKMKMTKNFKKYTKDTINGYVYVEKIS